MSIGWMPHLILRTASLLAPADRRAEWVREWRSELWYIPPDGAARFCLGAFPDALWVRRNHASPVKGPAIHLVSPLSCLAFLAMVAALSLAITLLLPAPGLPDIPQRLRARDLPAGCCAMLIFSSTMLPVLWLVMGRAPSHFHQVPWPNRVRSGIFLVLKIALVHPIVLASFLLAISLNHVVPIAALGIFSTSVFALRWVLIDQRERCPVCLRLLTDPVRIGTASQTLLEWYGGESACSRGHGLLHRAEIPSSYSAYPQWHRLDASWQGLFLEGVGRQ